jgi:hypothetical protein
MIRTRIGALGVALACAAVLTVGAAPALAKWSVHNSNDVTQMTSPPGGTEDQTCSDRLVGETGWSVFVSPDTPAPDPLPPGAFTGVNYELWKAPPGFSNMNEAVEEFDPDGNFLGYTFFDLNGDPFPATQVKAFTTAPRVALPQPIPVNGGPPTGDVYVFTAADFDEALSGVAPGDSLGLKPTGGATFLTLTAVDCSTSSGYTFNGFFAPVDNAPIVNVGRAGYTYPVKFSLTDASGAPVSDLGAIEDVQVQRKKCAAICNLPTDRLETSVTGGTSLRYDAATGRFVFKWKTPARGCYKLTVVLADGQSFPALFRLR